MTRCSVRVKTFVHKSKNKLETRGKCVGWTGVSTILSVHCSAKLHSKKGGQLIEIFKLFKIKYFRKNDQFMLMIKIIVNKDLTIRFS